MNKNKVKKVHLIVRKVGPIDEVEIYLNKVNVIMGPQSSGKSTLNKIACFCSWVEKKVSLDQSFDFFQDNDNFFKNLVVFHKLEGYLDNSSVIEYTSPVVHFVYKDGKVKFEWVDKYNYKRTKISYIPAERNIVSLISGWKQVPLPNNNILNFMSDWDIARKNYTQGNPSKIKYLDIEYYYNTEQDTDYIHLDNSVDIRLENTSSGQQSMIPLYVLVEYFTKQIYNNTENWFSVRDKEQNKHLIIELLYKVAHDYAGLEKEKFNGQKEGTTFFDMMLSMLSNSQETAMHKYFSEFLSCYIKTNYSSLFIEEPELNLFPLTQCNLLYYIINVIQSEEHDHKLFITTHSPYILYALNNCMMGWLVKGKMTKEERAELSCHASCIDPALVSVWEIKDGKLRGISKNGTIQGEDGLISRNYFDEVMKDMMGDFYKMLNYYGNDQEED